MAAATYDELRDERKALTELLRDIQGDSIPAKVQNLLDSQQGPATPISAIPGLYEGKTAAEWCDAFAGAQREIERLGKKEPSEGQELANIMAARRAS